MAQTIFKHYKREFTKWNGTSVQRALALVAMELLHPALEPLQTTVLKWTLAYVIFVFCSNVGASSQWDVRASQRLGRSSYKEQYAFFYRLVSHSVIDQP